MNRMPRPAQSPKMASMTMDSLLLELKAFVENEGKVRQEYPWAERFVMGLPLPPWQRPLKWSEMQMQRFITSAWTGVHLGSYVVTAVDLEDSAEVQYVRLSNCVMDGQQRLHAIEMYFLDRLAVPDAKGSLALWSDLDKAEQRWFRNRIFDRGTVPIGEEAGLRALYDLMNFGGTPHLESERAVQRG